MCHLCFRDHRGKFLCVSVSCGELSEASTHRRAPTSPQSTQSSMQPRAPPTPSCLVQECIIYRRVCFHMCIMVIISSSHCLHHLYAVCISDGGFSTFDLLYCRRKHLHLNHFTQLSSCFESPLEQISMPVYIYIGIRNAKKGGSILQHIYCCEGVNYVG